MQDASYQFTKILRVYFCKALDCTNYQIFLQAEDKSVASTEDFKLTVASVPGVTVLSSCMKEKDRRYYTVEDPLSLASSVYEYYILEDRK
ncbi:hypothetical protein RHMOL_Rhmol06G0264900 [Rhododendron molle]|uniref:Uncharacterized protein n=1 Tax=Rhododendron molle TaxID=49168 RepID=A0ACC0NGE2_RHOML|nr:hypothetical protein RHMOL_Rhmol06G0264900 [Rhododendron molle]